MRARRPGKRQAQARAVRRWTLPRINVGLLLVGVSTVAITAAVAWGVAHLLDPDTLPIRSVRVEGDFVHLSARQVRAAVAPVARGGFFQVAVGQVMRAAQSLPWVDRVSVTRIWPDTLLIAVTEQTPLARWGEHELINRRGQRFAPPLDTFPAGLPQLRGPDGLETVLAARYYEMARVLAPVGLQIRELDQDERRSWRMLLDNGIELRLGRTEAYERLLRFVRLYPGTLAPQAEMVGQVDLRYTNGFAVRWKSQEDQAGATRGG